MEKIKTFKIILIGLFLSACVSQPAYSQDLKPSDLYYYDGKTRIELQLHDGLIAEFGAPSEYTETKSTLGVRSLDSTATVLRKSGTASIWKTKAKGNPVSAAKTLNGSGSIRYSPLFTSMQGSSYLALPGNIIVDFQTSWSRDKVENFLASKGLRAVNKLEMLGHNYYEVETPAGAASLNIANSLYGQEGVVSSSPNWWRDVVAK